MTDYLNRPIDFARDAAQMAAQMAAQIAAVFDELPLWAAPFGQLLFDHLELRPNLAILDIGCATGFPLFPLANMHGDSCRLYGLDPWWAALERAEQKRAGYGLSNVLLICGDGLRLPFADESLDLVVGNLLINNVDDPVALLGECRRVLKPGGRLALTTNLKGHMREFYAVYRDVLQAMNLPLAVERLDHHEDHRGTAELVRALLDEAGFTAVRVIEAQFTMRYLNARAFFTHWLTRLGFLESWRAIVQSEDEIAVFSALEAELNALAAAQGELRMTIPMLYIEATRS
ncbi:MAG: class I SAM-dependent methyltransferase [bacterium]|nr:class I SAM-dependent methyltransferase [bacterium]